MDDPHPEKSLQISQLLLDTENPRLPKIQESQIDALREMTQAQGPRILALAQHLVEHGPNLASLLIVMPAEDDDMDDIFYVLDGNRRVAALKLLEAPSLAEGVLNANNLRKLKRLATVFEANPISQVRCIVFADRDEADPWIQLIHRGQGQGAGLVPWDGQVAARYDARKRGKSLELQVLEYVQERGKLSTETQQKIEDGRFPITNLQRLLNTPYVRKKLGVEKENGSVLTPYPHDELLKGLTRVVEDLGSGQVTVSKLKNQDQRIDYINNLPKEDLPDASKVLAESYPLGQQPDTAGGQSASKTSRKAGAQQRTRATIIPRNCVLKIPHPRLHSLYSELKRLNADDFPNAAAVMLRVFIELSTDYYLEHTVGWKEAQIHSNSLDKKLNRVIVYMEQNQLMTDRELLPIKKATDKQAILVTSVRALHAYVHNRYFSAQPSELRTTWDDFQPFMENLWPV